MWVLLFWLATSPLRVQAAEIGTINVSDLNLRTGPGKTYKTVLRLKKGARVTVVERRNGWLKIEHRGRTGYIRDREQFVTVSKLVPATSSKPVKDPASGLKSNPQTAENLSEQLRQGQENLDSVKRREAAVLNEYSATDQAMNQTRQQVQQARKALGELNRQIDRAEQVHGRLREKIQNSSQYAGQRLVALYKLDISGRIEVLAMADSFFDFIRRKSAMEKILAYDDETLAALQRDRSRLEALLAQLAAQRSAKQQIEQRLEQRLAQLSDEQTKRNRLLTRIRNEKSLALAAFMAAKGSARQLDAKMSALNTPTTAAAPETGLPAPKPFSTYRGLLNMPVNGKITSFFGPYRNGRFNVVSFQSGINIEAERGEPIRAVADGYTLYARWFKGYGNMIIVDHGGHYYTVYAHLEETFKVKGDRVEKGEVIATVGDSGSMIGPGLHFEVRHHGKPMDPLEWIKQG